MKQRVCSVFGSFHRDFAQPQISHDELAPKHPISVQYVPQLNRVIVAPALVDGQMLRDALWKRDQYAVQTKEYAYGRRRLKHIVQVVGRDDISLGVAPHIGTYVQTFNHIPQLCP